MKSKPERLITVSVRMPESLSKWLEKKAAENMRSRSSEAVLLLMEAQAHEVK